MPAAPLPEPLCSLAQERLQEDYLAFLADTASEDPKHYIARSGAAREALAHLAELRTLATGAAAAPDAEPTTDEVLEAARAGMAQENKT